MDTHYIPQKRRYMIDLETLGLRHDAVILSIGLVEFDINGATLGTELYMELDLKIQGFHSMCVDTVKWWVEQEKAGNPIPWNGQITPYGACLEITRVLGNMEAQENTELWANGTDFDVPKLVHMFTSQGCHVPWKHNQVRDLRTLAKLFPEIDWPENTQKHNALQDAICQANHAARILRQIGELS